MLQKIGMGLGGAGRVVQEWNSGDQYVTLKGRGDSHLSTWFPVPVPHPQFIKQSTACNYLCDKPKILGPNGFY